MQNFDDKWSNIFKTWLFCHRRKHLDLKVLRASKKCLSLCSNQFIPNPIFCMWWKWATNFKGPGSISWVKMFDLVRITINSWYKFWVILFRESTVKCGRDEQRPPRTEFKPRFYYMRWGCKWSNGNWVWTTS